MVGWLGVGIDSNLNSTLSCSWSWVSKSPENKLSRVGGWLDQVGIRLSQLSTKLKLSLATSQEQVMNK